jgi:4-amino-4-deoxy-L-arabinose transferase-like glycosyltransferase
MTIRFKLLVICFIGLVGRLIFIIFFNDGLQYPDEERFWEAATSLATRGELKSGAEYAHDMPLTAMLIALLMKLTGCGVLGVKVFFAFISAVTIYFISRLAACFDTSERTPVIAALIAAFYPFFIYYSSLVISETLFLFFVVITFWSIFTFSGKHLAIHGIFAGAAHLTRPTLVFFLPFLWLWSVVFRKVEIKYILVVVAVFLVIVLPWGIRNYQVIGSFVLTTSNSGHLLWEGNNPWNISGGVSGDFIDKGDYLADAPKNVGELELDKWERDKAIDFIVENPRHFLLVAGRKIIRFWNIWPNHELFASWEYKAISLFSYGAILLLTLMSPFFLWKERKKLGIIFLFALYLTAVHAVTVGSIRYRLPLEPLMIALAGATVSQIVSRIKK